MSRAIAIAMFVSTACFAQPRIQNAQIQTRPVAGSLAQTVNSFASSQSAPAWIGWSVPMVAGDRSVCWSDHDGAKKAITLEPPRTLNLFLRIEGGKIVKVRSATPDCEIDGNGAIVFWLANVRSDDSVALLSTLVHGGDSREEQRAADGAVSAIALHEGAAADSALDALATAPQPESIRRKAVFWLGNARGRHGYETLTRILRDDPSDKVREHAIFALTQSKEPGAIETMVKIAHEDRSAHVRGQALFWLAHTAQRKIAADEIARAVDNDPQTEVKKRAVFALSQLPNGEGVPKLIDLAKTNRNAEVRKQAMFWLGQSKDPRALDFFQQVLSH
jgi:HEAT repeat protein